MEITIGGRTFFDKQTVIWNGWAYLVRVTRGKYPEPYRLVPVEPFTKWWVYPGMSARLRSI